MGCGRPALKLCPTGGLFVTTLTLERPSSITVIADCHELLQHQQQNVLVLDEDDHIQAEMS